MSQTNDYSLWVVPYAFGWAVAETERLVISERFPVRTYAIAHAETLLRAAGGGELCILNEDGTTSSTYTVSK